MSLLRGVCSTSTLGQLLVAHYHLERLSSCRKCSCRSGIGLCPAISAQSCLPLASKNLPLRGLDFTILVANRINWYCLLAGAQGTSTVAGTGTPLLWAGEPLLKAMRPLTCMLTKPFMKGYHHITRGDLTL